MSSPETGPGRVRAYLQFIAAVCYFFLARSLAVHAAQGLAGTEWSPLLEQAMLVFLLLMGYAAMGSWMDRQTRPVSAQGLLRRPGWLRETGLGLSIGWAVAVVCVFFRSAPLARCWDTRRSMPSCRPWCLDQAMPAWRFPWL